MPNVSYPSEFCRVSVPASIHESLSPDEFWLLFMFHAEMISGGLTFDLDGALEVAEQSMDSRSVFQSLILKSHIFVIPMVENEGENYYVDWKPISDDIKAQTITAQVAADNIDFSGWIDDMISDHVLRSSGLKRDDDGCIVRGDQ